MPDADELEVLLERIGARAENLFRSKQFMCAESVLLAVSKGLGRDISEETAIALAGEPKRTARPRVALASRSGDQTSGRAPGFSGLGIEGDTFGLQKLEDVSNALDGGRLVRRGVAAERLLDADGERHHGERVPSIDIFPPQVKRVLFWLQQEHVFDESL
jgi:hypothetical protein